MARAHGRSGRCTVLVTCLALSVALLPAVPAAAAGRYTNTVELQAEGNVAAAVALSRLAFSDGAEEALLGRDDAFPDALASGAFQEGRPLLLTTGDALSPETADELERLGAGTVHILGGEQAVSAAVADELTEAGYEVTRLSGPTRIETAVEVAKVAAPSSDSVILARAFSSGEDQTQAFADSLAAGAWAASTGQPVLLTESQTLTAATAAYLAEREVATVTVVGGTAAISDAVVAQLEELGIAVERVSGATRFDTAVGIAAEWSRDDAERLDQVILVEGQAADAWASGFASAAYAEATEAPVLLSNGEELPAATTEYLEPGEDGTALLCTPLVTAAACDLASELLDQTPAGNVVLASDTVPSLTDLKGEVAPFDEVTAVTVDGCGLTGQAVTLDGAGAFSIRISTAPGECTLTFALTHTDDRVVTHERTITVTTPPPATVRPELVGVETVAEGAQLATVRYVFNEPVSAVYYQHEHPETNALRRSRFVLYGPRTSEERFVPDTATAAVRRDPQDASAVLVDYERADYDAATTAGVMQAAAQDTSEQRHDSVPAGLPLKAVTYEAGATTLSDLVSVGNFTTGDAPVGKVRARFRFEQSLAVFPSTSYVLVLPDGRIVPGEGTPLGSNTIEHTVQFSASDARSPAGTLCVPGTGGTCPSAEALLTTRRAFVAAAADRPLQSVDVAQSGLTDGPDLMAITPNYDSGTVRFAFDQAITSAPSAGGFHLFDTEGGVRNGTAASVVDGAVVVTFPAGQVSRSVVGAWVDNNAAQSSSAGAAARSVGFEQTFAPGEVQAPELVSARRVLVESDPGGTQDVHEVTFTWNSPVAIGTTSPVVYAASGEGKTMTACTIVTGSDDRQVACRVTLTGSERSLQLRLAAVEFNAVTNKDVVVGATRYGNTEANARL